MSAQQAMFDEVDCDPGLSQWFTHPTVARRIVEWTHRNHPTARNFLEPSAGRGAFVQALLELSPSIMVTACEIDPRLAPALLCLNGLRDVHQGDFLADDFRDMYLSRPLFDGAVMNPPYERDAEAHHVRRACELCGFVVALLRGVVKHGQRRFDLLWRWVDIRREVVFVERPSFGGDFTPMQDFVVLDLELRREPRGRGEPSEPHPVEWW